jgi:hypothetical protein
VGLAACIYIFILLFPVSAEFGYNEKMKKTSIIFLKEEKNKNVFCAKKLKLIQEKYWNSKDIKMKCVIR